MKFSASWLNGFQSLVEYKWKHGHCNVPQYFPENRKLGLWVKTQRKIKKSLPEECKEKLDSIGFVWDAQEFKWNQEFNRLESYHDEHGNCNSPELKSWVSRQVQAQFENRLSEDRVVKLESVGVVWKKKVRTYSKNDVSNSKWFTFFGKLQEFQAEHGHVDVPQHFKDKALGTWVNNQRNTYRRGMLHKERVKLLQDIGFKWNVLAQKRQQSWKNMYEKLKEYHLKDGEVKCLEHNRPLSSWCRKQRETCRKGQLSSDQKVLLDCLGFDFEEKLDLQEPLQSPTLDAVKLTPEPEYVLATRYGEFSSAPLKPNQTAFDCPIPQTFAIIEEHRVKPPTAPTLQNTPNIGTNLAEQLQEMLASGQGVSLESFERLIQNAKKEQTLPPKRKFDDYMSNGSSVGPPYKKRVSTIAL